MERVKERRELFESVVACKSAATSDPAFDSVGCPVLILVQKTGASKCSVELRYAPTFLTRDFAEALMMRFARLLFDLASNQYRQLGEYSVLGEGESDRLLVDWNRTEVEFDRSQCIHQLFEQQAARTPGARAVKKARLLERLSRVPAVGPRLQRE